MHSSWSRFLMAIWPVASKSRHRAAWASIWNTQMGCVPNCSGMRNLVFCHWVSLIWGLNLLELQGQEGRLVKVQKANSVCTEQLWSVAQIFSSELLPGLLAKWNWRIRNFYRVFLWVQLTNVEVHVCPSISQFIYFKKWLPTGRGSHPDLIKIPRCSASIQGGKERKGEQIVYSRFWNSALKCT